MFQTGDYSLSVKSSKPLPPIAGRGAPTNLRPTRTGSAERVPDGDWLDAAADVDGEAPRLRTTVTVEHPKTIITRNKSPDIGFDRSINPYRGCEHGCIYCFARPTHAFHDLSPGLDFESRLFAKPNAAAALLDLSARSPPAFFFLQRPTCRVAGALRPWLCAAHRRAR